MKKNIRWIVLILLCFPLVSFATFQLVNPYRGTEHHMNLEPASVLHQPNFPSMYLSDRYSYSTKRGYLKTNILRMAKMYHWKVQWDADDNYPMLLETTISGKDFSSLSNEFLKHYPLSAKYDSKHQLMIVKNKSS